MTFEPDTIEHLGVRMYSTLPPILAELIANAHDADAEHVLLTLNDSEKDKEIIVEDDGAGISFDEINEKFLRIGRNRREHDKKDFTPRLGRKIIGKKGLGKLSFFGIAHEIEISTRKNGKENIFQMNWEDIKKEEKEYEPRIVKRDRSCPHGEHGTKITLREIRRKSDFSAEDLANSLSKMFILEPDFEIEIRRNSEDPIIVSNEKKYEDLQKQVEWKIPDDYKDESDYEKAGEIKGHLMATEKPIPPKTNMRGITLFSRKKMVNRPEYFSNSTSSHFFSYLTGWLEVDFIDEFPRRRHSDQQTVPQLGARRNPKTSRSFAKTHQVVGKRLAQEAKKKEKQAVERKNGNKHTRMVRQIAGRYQKKDHSGRREYSGR